MFTPTKYPTELKLPKTNCGRYVALVRTLSDGSVTREYLPEHAAELVVAMIPFEEPMVASARIAYSEI